jgi:hypothetical protein
MRYDGKMKAGINKKQTVPFLLGKQSERNEAVFSCFT